MEGICFITTMFIFKFVFYTSKKKFLCANIKAYKTLNKLSIKENNLQSSFRKPQLEFNANQNQVNEMKFAIFISIIIN